MGYVTKYRTVSETKYAPHQQDMGYDPNPVHRPKFIFFEFSGLRPSTPHWFFFGGVNVTNYINTSVSLSDYNNSARSSTYRNPGDTFIVDTQYPASLGGPTNGGGISTGVNSGSDGTLSGVFYLQSNSTTNWSSSTVSGAQISTQLKVIDITTTNVENCLSYATTEYTSIGQYLNYYMYTTSYTETYQESYQEYVEDPVIEAPSNVGTNTASNDDDDGHTWISTHETQTGGSGIWDDGYTGGQAGAGTIGNTFYKFNPSLDTKPNKVIETIYSSDLAPVGKSNDYVVGAGTYSNTSNSYDYGDEFSSGSSSSWGGTSFSSGWFI